MCCIFTCCGWMIDLIQRLWTFTMSCIISSAVCCSLVTASMSGVALGYNYSLAEYIDLKETNVSVYLKRGIFDDEIADDMEWRRSGHQPVAGHIGENNLMTGSNDESTTLRSGRRLDDSIYESNDRNNFEGSLMRLTAKAPDPSTTSTTSNTHENHMIQQYPLGSLDQLKAVQSAINMKKAAAAARRMSKEKQGSPSQLNQADYSDPAILSGRRAMKFDVPPFESRSTPNSLRNAVPDDRINNPSNWMLPKLPFKSIPKDMLYIDDYMSPTYPSPITPRAGPARPTKPYQSQRTRSSATTKAIIKPTRSPEPDIPKSIDEEMESFKKKLMVDKFDDELKEDEFLKKIKIGIKKPDVDYEEQEIKGIPLRKKRNSDLLDSIINTNKDVNINEKATDTTVTSKILEVLKRNSAGKRISDLDLGDDMKNKSGEVKSHDKSTSKIELSSPNKLIRLIITTNFS